MKLTFIVNGTETSMKAKPSSKLKTLIKKALKQTGNIGRPAEDFQAICNDHNLQWDSSIIDQVEKSDTVGKTGANIVITEETVIFISLKAASGGAPFLKQIDTFQIERTKISGEMLENPDEAGIFPTTKCFESLDRLVASLIRGACIEFGAEYGYRKANPEFKMDVPSIVYEDVEGFFDKKYKQLQRSSRGNVLVDQSNQGIEESVNVGNDYL